MSSKQQCNARIGGGGIKPIIKMLISLSAMTNSQQTLGQCQALATLEDKQLVHINNDASSVYHESLKSKIATIRDNIGQTVIQNLTQAAEQKQIAQQEFKQIKAISKPLEDLQNVQLEESDDGKDVEDNQLSLLQIKVKENISKKSRKKAQQPFAPRERQGPKDTPTPTVIFHGVRQVCSEVLLTNLVEQVHQGTKGHVECIEIGNGDMTSLFTTMNSQTQEACKKIKEHPIFGQREFNILGLSQGGLIGRYIVESCDTKFTVRNLITVGAPNNGIDFEENCNQPLDNTRCEIQGKITAFPLLGPYNEIIQSTIGPSGYFKDHKKMKEYIDHASFLPYLNNEKDHPKANINKKRFESLNFFGMVRFKHDPMIYPGESTWFGETNGEGQIVPMRETRIFKENLFGLKTLHDESRLEKYEIDGVHLQFRNDHIADIFVKSLVK